MIKVTSYDWGHEGLVRNTEGILVDGWISRQADSAGGVSVKFDVRNYGSKPVRKFTVYFTPYNGAYEPVRCTVKNICTQGVSNYDFLGADGSKSNLLFKNAWYNHSVRSVSIDKIDVTYSDGTTESCKGNYTPSAEEQKTADSNDTKGCLQSLGLLALLGGLLFGGWWLLVEIVGSWLGW